MSILRYATITDIVPNKGRTLGYVRALDEEATTHYFNNGSLNGSQNRGLNVGDKVMIEYTSRPNFGCWCIIGEAA
mgnify:CR=1 FL=1